MRIEATYKGNYHLYADIDGVERKFILSKNKPEYALIAKTGLMNLTAAQLEVWTRKYFKLETPEI